MTAARKLGEVAGEALADVFGELGRTFELLGDYERADDAYRRASNCRDRSREARTGCVLAVRTSVASTSGNPGQQCECSAQPERTLTASARRPPDYGPSCWPEKPAHVSVRVVSPRRSPAAGLAAEQAERSGEKRALAIALHVRSLSLIMAGRTDAIDFMDGVLELFKELGDDVRVAMTLGNIAVIAVFFEFQWDKSAHFVPRR